MSDIKSATAEQPPTVSVEPKRKRILKVFTKDITRRIEDLNTRARQLKVLLAERAPDAVDIVMPGSAKIEIPVVVRDLRDAYKATVLHVQPSTKATTMRDVEPFVVWAGHRPVTRDLMAEYLRELACDTTLTQASKHSRSRAAIALLRWAHASGRITREVTYGLTAIHYKPNVQYTLWRREDVDKLIAYLKLRGNTRRMILPLLIQWHTGMSNVDACDLKWSCVDLENCVITIQRRKTGTTARIPFEFGGELHNALKDAIKTTIARYTKVAPGLPVTECAYRSLTYRGKMSECIRLAGLPPGLRLHGLRATLITTMVEKDIPIAIATQITGHISESVYIRYAKVSTTKIREAMVKVR